MELQIKCFFALINGTVSKRTSVEKTTFFTQNNYFLLLLLEHGLQMLLYNLVIFLLWIVDAANSWGFCSYCW